MQNYKKIAFIVGTLVMSIVVGYLAFAWSEPTSTPPSGNVFPPINESGTAQTKAGNLTVLLDFYANRFLDVQGYPYTYLLDPANPSTSIFVAGAIYGSKFMNVNDSRYYLDPTNTGTSMVVAGKIGVGTTSPKTRLDVVGEVKIASSSTSCTGSNEGAIRYLAAEGVFQGCNGTKWQTLGQLCEKEVTFRYRTKNVTYGVVESNGKCWLDRNLGAEQVAISLTDTNAYGDLFQWGRGDDGHQKRTSTVTSSLSTTNRPGHSNFIKVTASPDNWMSSLNNQLWQGTSGINNPCPTGWRIPTEAEWEAEINSWSYLPPYSTFNSPLKLTLAGLRVFNTGNLSAVGEVGHYASSSISSDSDSPYQLVIYSNEAFIGTHYRANGWSVRCIRDY